MIPEIHPEIMKPKSDLETCLLIGDQDEKKPKPASPPPQVTVMRFDKLHRMLFSTRLQICNAIVQNVGAMYKSMWVRYKWETTYSTKRYLYM